MKIKSDFVTNSSSTSYIIYLPENFDILAAAKEKVPQVLDWLDNSEESKMLLKDLIEEVKTNSEIYMDVYDWKNKYENAEFKKSVHHVFSVFSTIVRELGLIVDGIDTGPDYIQVYINVGSSKAKEKIKKIKSITGE